MSCEEGLPVSCTEVVLYNSPKIIKPFHEKTRQLHLCGREWSLVQDWDHQGVAGVVWEAVSLYVYMPTYKQILLTLQYIKEE